MNIPDFSNIFSRSIVPFRFVFIIWLLFVADYVYGYHFGNLGILPRNPYGLLGVLTGPLLHANLTHIVSNTFPLLILGAILFYFYFNVARRVFIAVYLIPNVIVWIFARPIVHIGASGVIYGIATFLVVIGVLQRNVKSILISLVVLIMYSSLFFGITDQLRSVSYEMHIAGVITGIGVALYLHFNNKVILKG